MSENASLLNKLPGEANAAVSVTSRNSISDSLATRQELVRLITGSDNDYSDQLAAFQAAYDEECRRGPPSGECRFNLAWALIRSKQRQQIALGVSYMSLLYDERFSDRDCLYYMALGEFRLDNLATSRRYLRQVLEISPNCREAISLLDIVDDKIIEGRPKQLLQFPSFSRLPVDLI